MRPELTGYSDLLSVPAGGSLRFMVSTDCPHYRATLVRLRHGDRHPAGPGLREAEHREIFERELDGQKQQAVAGSFAWAEPSAAIQVSSLTACAWLWPTTPQLGRRQGIVASDGVFSLALDRDGRLEFRVETDGGSRSLTLEVPLEPYVWVMAAASYDGVSGEASLLAHTDDLRSSYIGTRTKSVRLPPNTMARPLGAITLAAERISRAPTPLPEGLYNGKIDTPLLLPSYVFDLAGLARSERRPDGLLALWDLTFNSDEPDLLRDQSGTGLDAQLVNLPTQAVTAHNWTGDVFDYRLRPAEYNAIHFHDDDLEDARWRPSFEFSVPEDLPSGIYAMRLEADGAVEDRLPFVVRPRLGRPQAPIGLLLPTFTYLAYANEHILSRSIEMFGESGSKLLEGVEGGPVEEYLSHHPELGLSIYDLHSDGSGVCYSSRLRPIPNMRPDYQFWQTGGPERFAADLYISDWLEEKGFAFDAFTDDDLHQDGEELLRSYRAIVTGTHPEYWTAPMLDALESYLLSGGRLLYLGGNGFYWVTGVSASKPYVIEVRRGINGNRAWESHPGEIHMTSTGEMSSLWRYHGRSPNRLVGVGYSSQTYSRGPAAGYVRTPESYDPAVSFIFEGVGDEPIGDFGLISDGAAGYELDRFDNALGTPQRAYRLATSAGRHSSAYLICVEDLQCSQLDQDGQTNENVRSDIAYLPYPNGGAVFSVGSINWCASLSHAGYRNNVSQITENVLRRFLD